MRRVGTSRSDHVDLLPQSTRGDRTVEGRCTALIVDPVEQLRELASLVDRGLLSAEEFQRQRRKVFGA